MGTQSTGVPVIFALYLLVTGALVFFMLVTPYLALQGNPFADFLYDKVFHYLCHQKISRSICLFDDKGSYHMADCLPQTGEYREDSRVEKSALHNGVPGYKFPVSARDMFIYMGMFVGGLALLISGRAGSKQMPPAIWFILALVPIGIDGTSQTILAMRESTNLLRAITGFIAGFATGIYGPIILNRLFLKEKAKNENTGEKRG